MGQTVRTVKRVKLLRTCEADENADLEAKRRQNEIRLRGTFEAIFEKYARDFTGIGDEVNMETGTVEVDNGHLRGMRHERDILTREACILTGKTPSRAVDVNDGYEDELSTPFPPATSRGKHVPFVPPKVRKTMSCNKPVALESLTLSACLARGLDSAFAGQSEAATTNINHEAVFKLGQHIALQLRHIMNPTNIEYSGLPTPTSIRSFTPDISECDSSPQPPDLSPAQRNSSMNHQQFRGSKPFRVSRRMLHENAPPLSPKRNPLKQFDAKVTPAKSKPKVYKQGNSGKISLVEERAKSCRDESDSIKSDTTRTSARIMAKLKASEEDGLSSKRFQNTYELANPEVLLHHARVRASNLLQLSDKVQPDLPGVRGSTRQHHTRSRQLANSTSATAKFPTRASSHHISREPVGGTRRYDMQRPASKLALVLRPKTRSNVADQELISSAESAIKVIPVAGTTGATVRDESKKTFGNFLVGRDALQKPSAPIVVLPKRKIIVLEDARSGKPKPTSNDVPELNIRHEESPQPIKVALANTDVLRKSSGTSLSSRNDNEANRPEMLDELALPLQLATPKSIHRGYRIRVVEDVASEDELA